MLKYLFCIFLDINPELFHNFTIKEEMFDSLYFTVAKRTQVSILTDLCTNGSLTLSYYLPFSEENT